MKKEEQTRGREEREDGPGKKVWIVSVPCSLELVDLDSCPGL